MIVTPTVFVLGAGASAPYKFPVGGALANKIVVAFREDHALRRAIVNAGGSDQKMHDFARKYPLSCCSSVDQFLQSNPQYNLEVKLGIAGILVPREQDGHLAPKEEDWMAYLFDKIMPASPDELASNQLTIVTFNFDRSFERRLFLTLINRYGLLESTAAHFCRHVPVIHVHGSLGGPIWLEQSDGSGVTIRASAAWTSYEASASQFASSTMTTSPPR